MGPRDNSLLVRSGNVRVKRASIRITRHIVITFQNRFGRGPSVNKRVGAVLKNRESIV